MDWLRLFQSGIPEKMFRFHDVGEGFLLSNVQSIGVIKYPYLFYFFKGKELECIFSAEVMAVNENLQIGYFQGNQHYHLFQDNECRDQMVFLQKAMEFLAEKYLVAYENIIEIPKK